MKTLPQTEAQFQKAVIDLARHTGWLVAHFRPARTEEGWRTPVSADGAGFPDLVLVRDLVLYRELKSEKGRVRPDQQRWHEALATAGADIAVWRPSDWPAIANTLQSNHHRRST
jgi:hypothetical protein